MKVEELRIGNWVKIKDSIFNNDRDKYFGYSTNVFQIRGWNDGSHREGCKQIAYYSIQEETFGGKVNSGVYDSDIEPIRLTEEWLLKFRFEEIPNNWKCLDLGFATISWERLAGLMLSFEKESIYMPHIKYVHQLQNLYFALTGEELELKDKLTTK